MRFCLRYLKYYYFYAFIEGNMKSRLMYSLFMIVILSEKHFTNGFIFTINLLSIKLSNTNQIIYNF